MQGSREDDPATSGEIATRGARSVSNRLVAIGAGFALVPDLAGPPPEGVRIVPTVQPTPARRIFAAVRSGSAARPAVAAALDALGPLPH
jgi:DNA-binding transcriptional LysR family regulator